MAKNSEYQKHKLQEYKKKLRELEAGLPQYMRDYLNEKELCTQPSTVVMYAYDLRMFLEFLVGENPSLCDTEPKDIPLDVLSELTFHDINEYQAWLSSSESHENSVKGIVRRMIPLKGLFRFLVAHGYLDKDPTAGTVKYRRPPKDDIIRMNADETNSMMDTVRTSSVASRRQKKFCEKAKQRDAAIITLLLNTGIRVSECVGLDLEDLDFESGTMTIVRKGGKSQTLYLNQETMQALQDYIEGERKLLVGENSAENAVFLSNRKTRMCDRSIELMVKKYAKEAVPGKHITPHKLRSTYGTALYQATRDIRLVADVLGHEDINTTAKYYAAIEESHRKTAAQIELYKQQ